MHTIIYYFPATSTVVWCFIYEYLTMNLNSSGPTIIFDFSVDNIRAANCYDFGVTAMLFNPDYAATLVTSMLRLRLQREPCLKKLTTRNSGMRMFRVSVNHPDPLRYF